MDKNSIIIKGAREHNLKNIDVRIPRDKLVVITGISGSGKSSLAFDILYAEGRRRYIESLSAYARQFLGNVEKADVDHIEGLSPAIAIEQKTGSKNPRSTVGTVTEIYDYLRVLYARASVPHCPDCGRRIVLQSAAEIIGRVSELGRGKLVEIKSPLIKGQKGEHQEVLEKARRSGYLRAVIDGKLNELTPGMKLEKTKRHNVQLVVDRVRLKGSSRERLSDSVEQALAMGDGVVAVSIEGSEHLFSEKLSCPDCGTGLGEMSPRLFSFNSPYGACQECMGLGKVMAVDPRLVVDEDRSLAGGAVQSYNWSSARLYAQMLRQLSRQFDFSMEVPFRRLSKQHQQLILYGSGDKEVEFRFQGNHSDFRWRRTYEGIIPNLARRYRDTESDYIRLKISQLMRETLCSDCHGSRLRGAARAARFQGKSIHEVCAYSVEELRKWLTACRLVGKQQLIAGRLVKEINKRLGFICDLGLGYLSLARPTGTLSGGEAQRINLATQIGSRLVGILYILDEPSVGLHQRDNQRLLNLLAGLRDLGNTVLVVEHDREAILQADQIIDLGPGAGRKGGELVVAGSPAKIKACRRSLTGDYLSGRKQIIPPHHRRKPRGFIHLSRVCTNNLKQLDVELPRSVFCCITGVSGSGKSSLLVETLFPALRHQLFRGRLKPPGYMDLQGLEGINKVVEIDQAPIGRTPRSNPGTYTGAFDHIRDLFSKTKISQRRGYRPGRFSFNVKGGRCEACRGDGIIKVEMHFLPDIYIPCEVCKGKRYNRETLEVTYKGANIYEVLEMTAEEAHTFFKNIPSLARILSTVVEVGLGYIKLGQPATTLSGGEAQRVKLSTELSRLSSGDTIYILDEPTTGLHFHDVRQLLKVLDRLTESGNSVIVIEHNLDVIGFADYVIDLGPEGGDKGGEIVAHGTPEQVAKVKRSHTGRFLAKALKVVSGR